MNNIDISQEYYCPITFRLLGFGLIVGGLTYVIPLKGSFEVINLIVGIVLIIVGVILASTRYGLKINPAESSYTEYVWLLGSKIGKPVKFNHIEKFYINPVTETATISNYSGAKRDYSTQVYKAYMLLDNEQKIHVDTHRKEAKLQAKVANYEQLTSQILKNRNFS